MCQLMATGNEGQLLAGVWRPCLCMSISLYGCIEIANQAASAARVRGGSHGV